LRALSFCTSVGLRLAFYPRFGSVCASCGLEADAAFRFCPACGYERAEDTCAPPPVPRLTKQLT
jgi:predicted amidophosphoribosyltransferase